MHFSSLSWLLQKILKWNDCLPD